ncbi:MAG: hypothetical protein ACXACH_08290 [Candidatus Hermodarchaeia archaeon]
MSQQKDKHELSANAKKILHEIYGEEAKISVFFDKAISPEISGKYSAAQTLFPVELENLLDSRYAPKKESSLNHNQSVN